MKYRLQQQITQFFAECFLVSSFNRIDDLVSLLDGVAFDRIKSLLTIPGAAARSP